ncbi:hypothetical protein [Oryzifoliimicrobium ureilyticus]|uniref:hypothetical protein n=1 Tax=Oryzifoliimicrobium ureilyticus TaxID=3113724 RepID=UPI00307672B4
MSVVTDVAHVALSNRPLLVCDLDEVVLEFVTPFAAFLRSQGYELLPRSFRLHGNIVSLTTGAEARKESVDDFLESFFLAQADWQTPANAAVESLDLLSHDCDVVFLTAMPPRHQRIRRGLLDRLGLYQQMVATKEPKGPVVARLHGDRNLPVAFIDDILSNLISVSEHLPDCFLVHLMANDEFRHLAPPVSGKIAAATTWADADRLIRTHFGLPT